MRVVVVGATGNVGTSLLQLLADDARIDSILGVSRRLPELTMAKTEWAAADVALSDLVRLFRGADAVVHLAWALQPSRDRARLWRVNVDGSSRLFRAVAEAGVPTLVYASSVGAYAPGPKDRPVDESWPVRGLSTSFYARHKAEVERRLDRFAREHPEIRVVRLRPALIFKREAASGIRRLFSGPLLPGSLVNTRFVHVVPDIPRLRFQAVHSLDVAQAYRLALTSDAAGAFNVAAEPPLDPPTLARLLEARRLPAPAWAARAATATSWRLRLQPTEPGWLDLALAVPLMRTRRAREELGWEPRFTAEETLLELIAGLRDDAEAATPPLARDGAPAIRDRERAARPTGRENF